MDYSKEQIDYRYERLDEIASHVKEILSLLGEDVNRDGLLKTPERVANSLLFLTKGINQDASKVINSAIFDIDECCSSNLVGEYLNGYILVKDIEFSSTCEHHLLPFIGKVHIAYVPKNKILGLSKFARVVEVFAKRLQVQERMTREICDSLYKELGVNGVAVIVEAQHTCMQVRGVEKEQATTVTTAFNGILRDSFELRKEILELIKK